MNTAVVLAGGEGLRLRPLTDDVPKAMVPVAGKPLLEWILEWLKQNGITHVVIGVAYKKEKIIDHFGDGARFGLKIVYSEHSVEGGTSQGFKLAIKRHVDDEVFLAMNGDELVDVDLADLALHHDANGGVATIVAAWMRSPYGIVDIRGSYAVGFSEKPILPHMVSVGVYVFNKKILEYLPDTGNIEEKVFPVLAKRRELKAYIHNGFWATVNTAKDLADVEAQLKRQRR